MARAQGHRRLSLAVEPKNLRARLLYSKTGFREIREDDEVIVMVGNVDAPAAAGG